MLVLMHVSHLCCLLGTADRRTLAESHLLVLQPPADDDERDRLLALEAADPELSALLEGAMLSRNSSNGSIPCPGTQSVW